ncbi:MAG: sialidase family protein [Planctomycetota bacterium]
MTSHVRPLTWICVPLLFSAAALAGPLVSEYWETADPMPDLWGAKIGEAKTITFGIDRDLALVGSAALELVVDDIDAKREADISCNGRRLEIPDSLLGEGKGFKGRLAVPVECLKPGDNIISCAFADNLNGTTSGYAIMAAHLVLMVPENALDPARARDVIPDLSEQYDLAAYPNGLTGSTGADPGQVIVETPLPAKRYRIGTRGLYMTAIAAVGDRIIACSNYRFEGTAWRIKLLSSSDRGETWDPLPTAGAALVGREPRLTVLRDGTLLLTTAHKQSVRVYQSCDAGSTWSSTDLPDDLRPCRNVLENDDGSLHMLASKGSYFNPSASPSQAWIYESRDRGASWRQKEPVSVWDNPEPPFDEGALVRLADGRLLAAGRVTGNVPIPGETLPHPGAPLPWIYGFGISPGDESGDHMILSRSSDRGKTWSAPQPLTGYGQVHGHLLALADGRLLLTFARRYLPFGVCALVSDNAGKSWDARHVIRLALSQDSFVAWPVSLQLPDGSILTAYGVTRYLEHDDKMATLDAVAEAVRWNLPPR